MSSAGSSASVGGEAALLRERGRVAGAVQDAHDDNFSRLDKVINRVIALEYHA